MKTKVCLWCRIDRPLSMYARNMAKPDKHQPICKPCYAENWRKNHNIEDNEPIPRRSPYMNMARVLDRIESQLKEGQMSDALSTIESVRQEYSLA